MTTKERAALRYIKETDKIRHRLEDITKHDPKTPLSLRASFMMSELKRLLRESYEEVENLKKQIK